MNLHLVVDATTGEVVAHVLTDGHADDAGQVPKLPRQREGDIASLIANGAYDGEPIHRVAAARQPNRPPDVVILPRSSAVPSTADPDKRSQRDRNSQRIADHGRMAWQRMTGYGRRNAAETALARYKHLTGPRLRARTAVTQAGEVALAVQVLTRMTREAKPVAVRRR